MLKAHTSGPCVQIKRLTAQGTVNENLFPSKLVWHVNTHFPYFPSSSSPVVRTHPLPLLLLLCGTYTTTSPTSPPPPPPLWHIHTHFPSSSPLPHLPLQVGPVNRVPQVHLVQFASGCPYGAQALHSVCYHGDDN